MLYLFYLFQVTYYLSDKSKTRLVNLHKTTIIPLWGGGGGSNSLYEMLLF
jgi:hypothetical protein